MKYLLSDADRTWAEETLASVLKKAGAECARTGEKLPFIPMQGHYVDCMMPAGLWWWTNGFWPGLLWQAYHATKDEAFRDAAHLSGCRLAQTLKEPGKLEHDVGFLFQLSAVADYRLTGDAPARETALKAADFLADRFNAKGGFIRAWNESHWADDVSGWMIIDCMMNLSLLFWASEETGDARYADIACRHAKTAAAHLLREDGSCAHIAAFDAATGEFLSNPAGQGYEEGSSWGRGQGWAVYGFALAYRHTGDEAFLLAAKQSAHYAIAALSANKWLPLVDFRAPEEPVKFDSGAGVIIACGLLELAGHLPELERPVYVNGAVSVLRACTDAFVDQNPETDGILGGGRTMYHDERLADMAFIYGDYFYLEALLRLCDRDCLLW